MITKETSLIYIYLCFLLIGFSFLLGSCKNKSKGNKVITKDYIITGTCGENVKYKLYKDGTLKIHGEGSMTDYENEETPWTKYKEKITNVEIKGISTIGSYAFDSLLLVKEITIPQTVKVINRGAFESMEGLETIIFQGDLDYIGEYAIAACKSLQNINFEGNVKTLGDHCFDNSSLEELTIPNGVTTLPDGMCSYSNKLRKIVLPETIKNINLAFHDCASLEEVILPESVEYIDMGAFSCCPRLHNIIIPKNVKTIENFGVASQIDRKITILCDNMPYISCTLWSYNDVAFEMYVPAHLVSKYREHEVLQNIVEHIHSISNDDSYYNNYDYPTHQGDNSYRTVTENNKPNRYACRACRNQGRCSVCSGTGQTHTKRVYNYSLDCYDLDYETCRSCGGSGSCTACKGDGWLDEGVDY